MDMLTARYSENLAGVLSCYDRIVITGTLPGACFADGMTSFLHSRNIRIFDYPQFALPLRERIREAAQALAQQHGATIEHIARAHIRKEDVVAKVLAARGDAPGLVHVISAMETSRPTSRGTTRRAAAPSCGPTPPSACTTTSTGWTVSWG